MTQNIERLIKEREVLAQIADGINPLNGEQIKEKDFVHDPAIIRSFYYLSGVLESVIVARTKGFRKRLTDFVIDDADKSKVQLPEGNIGVNEFARCVNVIVDPYRSKKLTGVELNRQLKKMGILGEAPGENGKLRTVINEKSGQYGIETEIKSYHGTEYEAIRFNDNGKRFLLDNLEKIMSY